MAKILNSPFVDALEFGLNNLQNGITYNETVTFLGEKGWTNIENTSFRLWFYENFDCMEFYLRDGNISENTSTRIEKNWILGTAFDNSKSIMNGDAYFKYIDFVEVKKAFEEAQSAKRIANTALIVTIIVGIIQSILSLWQILKSPS